MDIVRQAQAQGNMFNFIMSVAEAGCGYDGENRVPVDTILEHIDGTLGNLEGMQMFGLLRLEDGHVQITNEGVSLLKSTYGVASPEGWTDGHQGGE